MLLAYARVVFCGFDLPGDSQDAFLPQRHAAVFLQYSLIPTFHTRSAGELHRVAIMLHYHTLNDLTDTNLGLEVTTADG